VPIEKGQKGNSKRVAANYVFSEMVKDIRKPIQQSFLTKKD